MSDEDVLGELGAMSPTVILRVVRLRYLGLLYRNGGDDLWSLIQQDQQWQALIHSDLHWMYQQLWNSSRLPDPAIDLDHWETKHTMLSYAAIDVWEPTLHDMASSDSLLVMIGLDSQVEMPLDACSVGSPARHGQAKGRTCSRSTS